MKYNFIFHVNIEFLLNLNAILRMWSDSGHFIPVEFTHYCQLTVYKTRSCCDVMEFLDTWNSLPIISKIDPNWNYFHETHNNVWKIISIRQLSYACSRCMYFSTFYSLIMNAKASKSCLSLLRQYVNVNIWVHFDTLDPIVM